MGPGIHDGYGGVHEGFGGVQEGYDGVSEVDVDNILELYGSGLHGVYRDGTHLLYNGSHQLNDRVGCVGISSITVGSIVRGGVISDMV